MVTINIKLSNEYAELYCHFFRIKLNINSSVNPKLGIILGLVRKIK